MSTAEKNAPAVSDEETTEDEFVTDGSEVSDAKKLTAVVATLSGLLTDGIAAFRKVDGFTAKIAKARCEARQLIVMPNGHPDWNAQSDTYRLVVERAEAAVWAKVSNTDKRRWDAAIRAQVDRKFREWIITEHVMAAMDLDLDTLKGLKWDDIGQGCTILKGEIPPKIRAAIAKEYRSTKPALLLPEKFGGDKKNSGGNAAKNQASAEVALENVAVNVAAAGNDGGPSHLSVAKGQVRVAIASVLSLGAHQDDITDRPQVREEYVRLSDIIATGIAVIDGKNTPEDLEDLAKYAASLKTAK